MEEIYTIKIRTDLDPSQMYPSERKYSASTVLGLGIVYLTLGITALLLTSLSLINYQTEQDQMQINMGEITVPPTLTIKEINTKNMDQLLGQMAMLNSSENENNLKNETMDEKDFIKIPNLTLAPLLLFVFAIISGSTGILAWKKWYINRNIVWFFISSSLSTMISFISFFLILISLINSLQYDIEENSKQSSLLFSLRNSIFVLRNSKNNDEIDEVKKYPKLRLVLALNILIASFIGFIWSILSMRISYNGMKNCYDSTNNEGKNLGQLLKISTIRRGNTADRKGSKSNTIERYPIKSQLHKYFLSENVFNDSLPKSESINEYQDRMNQFVSSNGNDNEIDKRG